MRESSRALGTIIETSERLGVLGSPSSTTKLALDILGGAVSRKLVGELALFRFDQDNRKHYALGQITEVQLRNIWHEDHTMRSLIRQRGRVDAVSERQDTHLGQMFTSAVFRDAGADSYEPSILGTVPPTGTPVYLVTDKILENLLRPYQTHLYYLGHVYGSEPRLPLWFKHFGTGVEGAGEAYHLGIFGKTGSGKSVLAKMILLAYARHRDMALLVIDPQGEFARDIRSGPAADGFRLPLGNLLERLDKKPVVVTVQDLVLDRWDLFAEVLYESLFFERLTMTKGENRDTACRLLVDRLKDRKKIKLTDLHKRASFDAAWSLLGEGDVQSIIYKGPSSRARFNDALEGANQNEFFQDYWTPVASLFCADREGVRRIDSTLHQLLGARSGRHVVIVDLSAEKTQGLFWNDKIQSLVIKRLLEGLTRNAEEHYHEGRSLNTLVVIDEAHRLAPRERPEEVVARSVRARLIDATRTTRKYGLGWLFISQTLSSLSMEVLQQLRISFFGFGLALGQEFQSLKQLVGSSTTALGLYESFRDPHSAFDTESRQYSFMTSGPVSPLSFASTPLFFNAFNTVDDFLTANGLTHE